MPLNANKTIPTKSLEGLMRSKKDIYNILSHEGKLKLEYTSNFYSLLWLFANFDCTMINFPTKVVLKAYLWRLFTILLLIILQTVIGYHRTTFFIHFKCTFKHSCKCIIAYGNFYLLLLLLHLMTTFILTKMISMLRKFTKLLFHKLLQAC